MEKLRYEFDSLLHLLDGARYAGNGDACAKGNSRINATQKCDGHDSESGLIKLELLFYRFLITKTYKRRDSVGRFPSA
jgi:hypothetical protein